MVSLTWMLKGVLHFKVEFVLCCTIYDLGIRCEIVNGENKADRNTKCFTILK